MGDISISGIYDVEEVLQLHNLISAVPDQSRPMVRMMTEAFINGMVAQAQLGH